MSTVKKHETFIATRWSLLSRLRDLDDQTSWQDFFDTYWRLIYGVARRSGLDEVAAQDVVQDTVLAVVRNLPQFKTDPSAGSFKAWLLRIVSWRVADQFRARQRRERQLAPATDQQETATRRIEKVPDPAGPELEHLWNEEWEKNLLESAMERVRSKVSARQFQMFDLYVIKQWPVRDVARALHTTIGHVYVAKHRVSALLKKEIRELGAAYA